MARKTTSRKGAQTKKGNPKESDLFVELDKDGYITLDLYDRGRKGINAKITLCDAFVIYARVIEGEDGPFLSYPNFKTKDGKYVNQAYCFDKDIIKAINEALDGYIND